MASVSIGITILVGIGVSRIEFYMVNSINSGIDVYGAMACVCWIVNFFVEDVRRPDNGSKTLSEVKFQQAEDLEDQGILCQTTFRTWIYCITCLPHFLALLLRFMTQVIKSVVTRGHL